MGVSRLVCGSASAVLAAFASAVTGRLPAGLGRLRDAQIDLGQKICVCSERRESFVAFDANGFSRVKRFGVGRVRQGDGLFHRGCFSGGNFRRGRFCGVHFRGRSFRGSLFQSGFLPDEIFDRNGVFRGK